MQPRHSIFRLSTLSRMGRTCVDDLYFEAPFKLMHPFMQGGHADFMVMLASPGFLAGDHAAISCRFGPGTDSTIETQSYEKVFDTGDDSASRTIDLEAIGDARAIFLPFPVIPFRNSTFTNHTTARIAPESAFVFADIVTCGRVGMGERWRMRSFTNLLRVVIDPSLSVSTTPEDCGDSAIPEGAKRRTRLAFADRMMLNPSMFDYKEMCMWRDYTHNGVLYAHLPCVDPGYDPSLAEQGAPSMYTASHKSESSMTDPRGIADRRRRMAAAYDQAQDSFVDQVRALATESDFSGEMGVSRLADGIIVRVLTSTGDDAFQFIRSISEIVR